jgi:undecaprenyl diphosphate synthase
MNKGIPHSLGFIMDGNRRFAAERDLPHLEGHRKGAEVLSESIKFFAEAGVRHLVYYAFSTENWRRSETEVSHLMSLFNECLEQLQQDLDKEGKQRFRLRIIGQLQDFDPVLQEKIMAAEAKSLERPATTTVWIALSYGGRSEIIAAVNEAVAKGEMVDETSFESLLWSAGLPDPDMIVRTSGEKRLSNFLTWRSVYSELHFIDAHWPALSKTDFMAILSEYEIRERRHGA